MATYTGVKDVTQTLTAATADTVTLTGQDIVGVEVSNRELSSSTNELYVRVDGTAAAVGADNNTYVGPGQRVLVPCPALEVAPPKITSASTATTGGTLSTGQYWYRVSALVNGQETPASDKVEVHVPADSTDAVHGDPAFADNLTPPTLTSTNTVTLNWGAVSGATGYRIYRSQDPFHAGDRLNIADLGAVTTYTDTGATLTKVGPNFRPVYKRVLSVISSAASKYSVRGA